MSSAKKAGGSFFGVDDCYCGCCNGCVVAEVTLYRPIVWPGVKRCAIGWRKYKNLKDHPREKRCKKAKQWRILNTPTCQVVASGKINCDGDLEDLPDSLCYPMPYEPPCPNKDGPWDCDGGNCPKLQMILLPFIFYMGYSLFNDFMDTSTLLSLLTGSMALGLHCDGDLTCRYLLQLQTGCLCPESNKIVWPGADPCVPNAPVHGGVPWQDVPNPTVP